jgi:hypothetical protein
MRTDLHRPPFPERVATVPVHDWTRVPPGIFHDFHHEWISAIKRRLNRGVLPAGYYALAEQIAGGLGPDVLTLEGPTTNGTPVFDSASAPTGCAVALATIPPPVWHRAKTEVDLYAAKAKAVTIRHASNHRVIAIVEIVSPGNKSSRQSVRQFAEKAEEFLRAGVHLLVVDLFPPSPRDPQGIHRAIWDQFVDSDFILPRDKPLTLAAYIGGPTPETFVNVTAVGLALPDMPLFLTPDEYVPLPLEPTYQSAWEAVPAFWQGVVQSPDAESSSILDPE